MSSFRFRLERVLAWRETQLAIEEADLERLRLEKAAIEQAIGDLAAREARETKALNRSRRLPGADVARIEGTRRWIAQDEKRLRLGIADCARAIEKRASAVTEARRKVRLIEKLRERRLAHWQAEENRQLEAMASESAIASWLRKNGQYAGPDGL